MPAAVFEAGGHAIRIWTDGERWRVSVDGARIDRWFSTQVDAWQAGVAEADRRGPGSSLRATGTDLHPAG